MLIQALRCLLMPEEEGEVVGWMIPHRSGHGEGHLRNEMSESVGGPL